MPKIPKKNNTAPQQEKNPVLAKMQKRIAVQAAMALTAIGLTVVMIFAMTAAWYTNIVHTSGLTFEVEAWGFNGDISSEMAPIEAGPGDEGLIELEVASASNSPSAVSVSFSKSLMPTLIQQRIFFYVDTQTVRNGETVDRVYLNSRESYTYNLFSQGKLTLTETVHNAPQLKWHWVYDVLGYYVQGNLVELAEGKKAISVSEYLRPIEYDYDAATMKYDDATGTYTILTVDGTRTPEQFLVEFSKTDGYDKEIDTTKAEVDDKGYKYYPVDVDENGNGVYAYLCSYAEIQQNTAFDTALGQGGSINAEPPYQAKLMVSAQKTRNTVINVNSLSGLKSAIELGAADSIQLSSDVHIGTDEVLTIASGQRVMLDLNGKRLISSDPDTIPIEVQEGGSLTIVNGSLVYENKSGTASKSYAIHATGAEIVMSDVDLSGYKQGLRITDQDAESSRDSTVRLVGCEWTTEGCTLLVYGNGTDTVQRTQVIIENSTLKSNNITLSGNGNGPTATSGGSFGTDIQIIDSTITSAATLENGTANPYSAIYHPQQDSVLTIYNSKISGYTGIAIKGGTVNIIGSTVEGLGNGMNKVEEFAISGFNDTGDAVYIETNYNYPIELNITDLVTGTGENIKTTNTVLTSACCYALRVYDPKADWVDVNIVSGTFQAPASPAPDMDLFAAYLDPDSEMKTNYVVTQKTEQASDGAG